MKLSALQFELLSSLTSDEFTHITELDTHANLEKTHEICKRLALRGLLRERYDRSYCRTTAAQYFLRTDTTIADIEASLHRIIDLSYFEAENVNFRNTKFLFGDGPYPN